MAANPTGLGWRLRNSWWVLLVVLGLGCLGGSGYLYIGITARKPAWWGLGVVYLVLPWAGLVAINRLGQDSSVSTAIAVGYFVLWFESIVHALFLNGSWLRWRAANRPWFEQPPVLAPPPVLAAPPVAGPPPVVSALDVNAATVAQLVEVVRLDPVRAGRLIADREARGGFQTVEEFGAALAPHEFARVRGQLTCTPRPRARQNPAGPGRVVDF
ncbi:helix-hairpin-helix domain-containing protein [Dactylosporangium sp. NPDC051485]|uniref:ComEA family DNA-binding protein n=1 Tax=Dactylosporangium sp. NPDC051485 TaxID=3154846 RepID=UPI00341F0CA1